MGRDWGREQKLLRKVFSLFPKPHLPFSNLFAAFIFLFRQKYKCHSYFWGEKENRNQRWKTGINGVPFSGHPGANTVPSVHSVHSVPPQPIISECAHHSGSAANKKNTDTSALATASTSLSRQAQLHTFTHLRCSSHHPGSAGNALQPEFWEYWEY